MWNERTKQLVADDQLVVLGVVQEQHAERTQLYRQWKQYEFPIAQDATTELGLAVVPVPVLIDEYGIVLSSRPKLNQLDTLIATQAMAPSKPAPKLAAEQRSVKWLKANSDAHPSAEALCAVGDALLKSGSPELLQDSLKWYLSSMKALKAANRKELLGPVAFRIGVAYRMLFDRAVEGQDPSDFSRAAEFWSKALSENPNQYIWRRRIQQYGPTQAKPYPFYDWVERAQAEISARGEQPERLVVELTESERAIPVDMASAVGKTNPDPAAKITQVEKGTVGIRSTVVGQTVKPGKEVRVYLHFDPKKVHWNNEAENMLVWVEGQTERYTHPNAEQPASNEVRTVEFDYLIPRDAVAMEEINGYALFYVCKTEDGQCLYRRQDFTIPITTISANQ